MDDCGTVQDELQIDEIPNHVTTSIALVVDENELFRLALGHILRKFLGFTTMIEAATLEGALGVLGTLPQMSLGIVEASILAASPGPCSLSGVASLRGRFPGIRIVTTCAPCSRRDILRALDLGVHGVLPKTLSANAMAQALGAVMAGAIYVPTSVADLPDGTSVPPVIVLSSGQVGAPHGQLTPRQRDVLPLLAQGKSNKAIARDLGLSESTVKIHLAALFRNLGVTNRASAAVAATRFAAEQTP